jgi:hypothetical protein
LNVRFESLGCPDRRIDRLCIAAGPAIRRWHSVTVADFVLAYTLDWAKEVKLLNGFPGLAAGDRWIKMGEAARNAAPSAVAPNQSSNLREVFILHRT